MDLRSESLSNELPGTGGIHEFAAKVAETMAAMPSPQSSEPTWCPRCKSTLARKVYIGGAIDEWRCEDCYKPTAKCYLEFHDGCPMEVQRSVAEIVRQVFIVQHGIASAVESSVAAERERCAKIIEDQPLEYREVAGYGSVVDEEATIRMLAAKIREVPSA
jgi:ribosomal protein L37AE/L43A